MTNQKSDDLLNRVNLAVAAVNEAQRATETAQAELVLRSKAVGLLLLEAKKLHPKVADFQAFLKRVNSLSLSRAYDYLRIAGGRTTDEQLREEARQRKQKSRANKKVSEPEPSPISVTEPDVTESPKQIPAPNRITESPEINAEERRAMNAALDDAQSRKSSRRALNEFIYACKNYLPKITEEADRQEAVRIVTEMLADKKAEAA